MDNNKITVKEYLENNELLSVVYIPFEEKLGLVSKVLNESIKAIGGLNTTLVRRLAVEIFIEAITNIDMKTVDENGLSGYDQICYSGQLESLIDNIGNEYLELDRILHERMQDYIRIESNPSITINEIYDQVKTYLSTFINYFSNYVEGLDVEKISNELIKITQNGGDVD